MFDLNSRNMMIPHQSARFHMMPHSLCLAEWESRTHPNMVDEVHQLTNPLLPQNPISIITKPSQTKWVRMLSTWRRKNWASTSRNSQHVEVVVVTFPRRSCETTSRYVERSSRDAVRSSTANCVEFPYHPSNSTLTMSSHTNRVYEPTYPVVKLDWSGARKIMGS